MHRQALTCLQEADEIAAALGDRRRQGGVRTRMVECLYSLGRYDEAVDVGERALELAEEFADEGFRAYVLLQLAQAYRTRGEYRRAADLLRHCIEAADKTFDLHPFGLTPSGFLSARPNLVWLLRELGEFDEAVAHGAEGMGVAEASGVLPMVVLARTALSATYLERGEIASAVPLLERALDLARSMDAPNISVWSLAVRGAAYILAGQAALAIPLLEESLEMAAANAIVAGYAYRATWLGEAYLAAGRVEDARQTVTDALARATARQERANRAYALRALGEIAASEEPPDVEEAEAHFREALALAEELGMRPLEAHCHLGLGKLYRRVGRVGEARTELSTAVEMHREMGMTFWLPEAEAELAEAVPPSSARHAG
jgi:tetratricopeptide (TPR) repeat protein